MADAKKPRFMTRDAKPRMATTEDFAALFERELNSRPTIPQDIPVDRIRPNPFQARTVFHNLDELTQAIQLHGFTSRLRVRRDPSDPQFFQLVFGERRLRAARAAGLTVVPCDVADHSDAELVEIGLTENLQREDLNPLEEAHAFQVFVDERGYSIRTLAERIGKHKGYVENRLGLLRTPPDVQQMIAERPDTIAGALLLAKLPTSRERRPLIEGLLRGELSVKDIRAALQQLTREEDSDTTGQVVSPSASSVGGTRMLARTIRQLDHVWERMEAELPSLEANERGALLAYIVDQHFPRLEKLVEELRVVEA